MAERGWVPFLSPVDRDGLAHDGGKGSAFGLGLRPALVVVDVYREALGHRHDADDLDRWPMSCGTSGWEAVDRIAELIEDFRRRSIPVIHVKGPDRLHTRWGHRDAESREADFEIVPEVAPLPGELVIEKAAPSAFQGTPLAFHLVGMWVDTIVVCGEATSGCIRATVVDGATQRLRVAVVEECCFDRTEASHWINLFDMDQKYADVMTREAVVKYLDDDVVSE